MEVSKRVVVIGRDHPVCFAAVGRLCPVLSAFTKRILEALCLSCLPATVYWNLHIGVTIYSSLFKHPAATSLLVPCLIASVTDTMI